jgi:hypothetical protein
MKSRLTMEMRTYLFSRFVVSLDRSLIRDERTRAPLSRVVAILELQSLVIVRPRQPHYYSLRIEQYKRAEVQNPRHHRFETHPS